MNDTNKEFITEELSNSILSKQINLTNRIANLADLGFINDANTDCELSIMVLLEHALDNVILYSKEQFDNILLLYNKVSYVG